MSYALQQPIINYHAHTIHLSKRSTDYAAASPKPKRHGYRRLSNEKTNSDALDSSKR